MDRALHGCDCARDIADVFQLSIGFLDFPAVKAGPSTRQGPSLDRPRLHETATPTLGEEA